MAYQMNYNVGSNNQNQQNKGRTTYTPIRYSNPESSVDKTRLSIEYWNSTIKFKIANRKETPNGEITYDDMDSAVIFLTSDKARILINELKNFINDSVKYNNCGVNTAKAVVVFNNGAQFGTTNPCMIIRQIDPNDGTIQKTYAYEFKTNYHFAIRNLEASDNEIKSFDKEYEPYRNLELTQIVSILENFCDAASYAYAAIQSKAEEYRENALNNKIDGIMAKLGVEYTGRSQRGNNNYQGSIFDSNRSNSYSTGNNIEDNPKYSQLNSLDDIDDGMLD